MRVFEVAAGNLFELSSDSFTVPAAVRKAAKRGLELREKHGRGGTAVGVARARDLKNGKVSFSTVKRMKAYFDRHEVDKKGEGWGVDSAGYIAWILWGGDAGWSWARKIIRQQESETAQSNTTIKLKGFGPSEKTKSWVAKISSSFYKEGNNNYIFWNHDGEIIPFGKEKQKDIAAFVQFELVPKQGNNVELKWMAATPQRTGLGSKALKILQKLATKDKIDLTLFPWDKGTVSQSKLTRFYKKHGFIPIGTSKNMIWKSPKDDSKEESFDQGVMALKKEKNDPCWKGYVQRGMKKKGKRMVPNCIPQN